MARVGHDLQSVPTHLPKLQVYRVTARSIAAGTGAPSPGPPAASWGALKTRLSTSRYARRFEGSAAFSSRAAASTRRKTTAASRSKADPACLPASASTGLSAVASRSAGQRRRPMFVDDTTCSGFECAGERRRGFGYVVVDDRLQFRRLVLLEERADDKKQLRLPLAQVAHALHEQLRRRVAAAERRRPRVIPRGGQVGAIARALNLHQALGAAADGTNLLIESRTSSPRAPFAAQRTDHKRSIV